MYPLELTAERATSKTPLAFTRAFAVARAHYPQVKVELTVEKKFTEPSPEQQEQIAEGVKIKQDYLSRVTPTREWDGNFSAPAEAAISDVFGSQRIFNGKAQRPHLGTRFPRPHRNPGSGHESGHGVAGAFLIF